MVAAIRLPDKPNLDKLQDAQLRTPASPEPFAGCQDALPESCAYFISIFFINIRRMPGKSGFRDLVRIGHDITISQPILRRFRSADGRGFHSGIWRGQMIAA